LGPSWTILRFVIISFSSSSSLSSSLSGKSASDRDVKRWRESELKHGRLAMLAFVGICTAEWGQGVRIPLFNGIEGPAIYHYQQV